MRGCTAAASAMLIYDAGKQVDVVQLKNTNLGNSSTIEGAIRAAALTPLLTILDKRDNAEELLLDLKALLQKNGSAIVSTGNDIGAHVVVVDQISDDLQQVRLRDPFHGWEITVKSEAFLRGFNGGNIIQIAP